MNRLGRLARTISGVGFPLSDQGSTVGDVPFLKVSDLADPRNAGGIVTAANWVSASQAKSLGVRTVPVGSVVFPKVGAALLGNARAITKVRCAMDNNLMAVAPRNGESRYWYYAMRTVDMADLNLSGTIPFVSDSAVRDLLLPVDRPVEDQRRVADFLDDQVARIDNMIGARTRQLALLTESVASHIHDEVTGCGRPDRRPSRLAWATDLPTGWASVRLAFVARIGTGHTPSRSHPGYWSDCEIPWLTTSDVFKFRFQQIDSIDDTEVKISSLGLANSSAVIHPPGTVALSRTSGSAGFAILMGRAMATSQDFATWTPGPDLRSEYLLWCLRAMHRDLMRRLAMGSTHLTIYFPDLLSIRVPLPPLSSQDAAIQKIRDLTAAGRSNRDAIRLSITLLEELKRSLITAAVTGEFDVSSANGSRVPVA